MPAIFRTLLRSLLLASLTMAARANAAASDAPLVSVDQGVLRGAADHDIERFMGIPYAAPPVGALRWRAPQPAAAWTGARAADSPRPICMQPTGPHAEAGVNEAQMGEDCLYLNIWRPAGTTTDARLPVMVWIHGGAFRGGAGSLALYDGSALARHGVIVVTINYRLGAFGTFSLPALRKLTDESGNFGLQDQEAALRWVQRNVAKFGGDPGRVTLFGESAGGASVLYQMTRPTMRGLFARAIVESGAIDLPEASLAEADQIGERMAAQVLPAKLPQEQWVDALRRLPASAVLQMPASRPDTMPYIDGKILTRPMLSSFEQGDFTAVPTIIGRNDDEAGFFPAAFSDQIPKLLGDAWPHAKSLTYGYAAGSEELARQQVATMLFVGTRTRRVGERIAASGAPVHMYRFAHVREDLHPRPAGAVHTAELPFVFGTLPGSATAPDRQVSEELMRLWTDFAKGQPLQLQQATPWPEYSDAKPELACFDQSAVHACKDPDTALLDDLDRPWPFHVN